MKEERRREHLGNLTSLEYTDEALVIRLTDKGRIELEAALVSEWRDDWALWSILEEHWTNGALDSVRPEEVGALTDSPIYVEYKYDTDRGDLVYVGRTYWFPAYMCHSLTDAILQSGEIVFSGEENNKDIDLNWSAEEIEVAT